jgi:2,3-bisphosphoglycerate-independent phosphoglycerate mutase
MGSDGVTSFGEHAAANGRLGTMRGVDILPRLVPLLSS